MNKIYFIGSGEAFLKLNHMDFIFKIFKVLC